MMESSISVQKDFKKWLVFNESLKNPDNLYNLYKALTGNDQVGIFDIRKDISEGESRFQVVQEGYHEVLEFTFDKKADFQSYIKQNYFPDKDIEQWYQEKKQQNQIDQSQAIYERDYEEESDELGDIKPHAKEVFYKNFKIAFSLIAYIAIVVILVITGFTALMPVGIGLGLVVFYFLVINLVKEGIIAGYIQGNYVRISEAQYKDLYEIVVKQSEALKIKVPKVYITNGGFNAMVTKLIRSKYLVLNSEVIETYLGGEDRVIKYVIGHELGHIKRKHLSGDWWLFPSLFVPFLPQAYSRGRELTCDRIGYHFSKKGAIAGMMIMTVGKEISSQIKADQFLKDSVQEGGFWFGFSEVFMMYPHLSNRIEQIRRYDSFRN